MSLGDLYLIDSEDTRQVPRIVESLRGQRVHELAAGFKRTLILTGSGQAQSVTHTVDQLSGLDGQLAQVSFGGVHMLALTRSGQVYTLGDGSLGQLGHGNLSSCPEPRCPSGAASLPRRLLRSCPGCLIWIGCRSTRCRGYRVWRRRTRSRSTRRR